MEARPARGVRIRLLFQSEVMVPSKYMKRLRSVARSSLGLLFQNEMMLVRKSVKEVSDDISSDSLLKVVSQRRRSAQVLLTLASPPAQVA